MRRSIPFLAAACAAIGALLAAMLSATPALAFPGGARGGTVVVRQSAKPPPMPAKPPPMSLRTVAVTPLPLGDEVVTASGDRDGWHLYAAASGDGWRWHPLATLAPAGVNVNGERWIGRQCLTGDGRYVVAVIAPWSANNDPAGMGRGGLAYSVDAHTGAVRPLAGGVSLHYFTPSCGTGSAAALTRYLGSDEQATQLVRADAASGRLGVTAVLPGEVTGAVPVGMAGFVAARGTTIERITSSGRETVLARVDGQPFDLTANAAGGVDFLLGRGGDRATVWQATSAGVRQVGTGSFTDLALFTGRGGYTIAVGATRVDPASGIRALGAQPAPVEAVSLDATAVSVAAATGARPVAGPAGADLPRAPLQVRLAGAGPSGRRPGSGGPTGVPWVPDVAAPATTALPPVIGVAGGRSAPTAGFVSTCAVPRNHVDLQAMQPSPSMVDWAANLAGQRALSGTATRPAGFANLGLPAYAPGQDFPMPALSGAGGSTIPREVLEGIFSQESNLMQATWHSIEGVSGNPLIADYYGAAGGYQVGVATPDCGYGIGQVTTGMTVGAMNYDLQRKVAVDYAENIAAAAQILTGKWNELIAAGITANNSDPAVLENWYLAIWDYNSGLHPNTGGPWGLGWANNPANPAYPYNRHPFLHQQLSALPLSWLVTYDDAKTPGNWPYQEKVFGWMEVPLIDATTGLYSYSGTLEWSHDGINDQQLNPFELARPDLMAFCDVAKNQCDPATAPGGNPCTLSSLQCWWHYPASWCTLLTNICHGGSWTVTPGAAEPGAANDYYPSVCDINTQEVPPGSAIVDSQPSGVNLQGCDPATENWHSTGTFAFTSGDPNNPAAQQTDMDLHQLGTGLGGHIWFTHTNEPTDPAGASYWGLTGTWTPALPSLGNYTIKVFIPAGGATSAQANYSIDPGYGSPSIVAINQGSFTNQWISLGTYWLGEHATVSLTNLGTTASGDLAFSGLAFVPAAGPAPYAILGDSYSSGEGTSNYDADTNTPSNTCHRSPSAFGRVYAASSSAFAGGNVEHLACSGATTASILTTGLYNEPPQVSELLPSARLVTVTIGGNDVGFAGVLARCVTPLLTCEDYYTQDDSNNLDAAIENLRGTLAATYTAIKQKAPAATVIAVTYPNIFEPGSKGATCASIGAIGSGDVEWLIRETFHLDDVIEAAARDAGIQVLDERYAFLDHELCSATPWVNGLFSQPITDISGAFHPNAAGYAAIAADLKGSPVAPASRPAATWGGWRNAAMAARMPTTTRALQMFNRLQVANASNTSYSATYFGGWSTAPPSVRGCDRRTYVLTRDADPGTIVPAPGSTPGSMCAIASASWQSPYDAPGGPLATVSGDPRLTGSPGSPVDIDHVVSKKDAWVSGADQWIGTATNPNEERTDFANDADGLELLTVSARVNGKKLDKTPDQWLPDNSDPPGNPAFTCDFLKMYVAVKWQYQLTITLGEWNTINTRLTIAACGP